MEAGRSLRPGDDFADEQFFVFSLIRARDSSSESARDFGKIFRPSNNILLCNQELIATSAHRIIQDQNLNILYNGAKIDAVKAKKKRRVVGRKALNDISNSTNLPPNVISIEKNPIAVAKAKLPKTTEKGKVGDRKALTDVTNSECVKAWAKGVDVGYFLKSVGLSNDFRMQVSASRAIPLPTKKLETNSFMHWEMKVMLFEDREVHQCRSSACGKFKYFAILSISIIKSILIKDDELERLEDEQEAAAAATAKI
ncbi:hypothetical protein PHJA_002201500 [Phtheirospermum japonicum]|uniref:Uncharacterized protein n=1 Tax=Phtheirospermum japonicum TaxID=374723 RepID=A0A830CZZ6_9LAMI|nr:hypothetical protein PHJA_002201500 [Phtheirospermum japonicum]